MTMKLSLSGRLFESAKGYVLGREDFLAFAKATGFEGVELRYPQMPMETPAEEVARVRLRVRELGLTWVFGTVEGIHEPGLYERSLKTMRQQVDGGALYTRCTVFKPEQVEAAQRFADAAAAMGQTLLMQLHTGTMPDTVEHVVETFRAIGRKNVRLAFDPNHLLFAGDTKYAAAVERLAPLIETVSLQNYKIAPPGVGAAAELRAKIGGKDYVRAEPGDPEGIDFPQVFGPKKIGFNGWVTMMGDCIPGMEAKGLGRKWFETLRLLV